MSDLQNLATVYRLPNPSTREDLDVWFNPVVDFGDKVLIAGYYCNGKSQPSYYGAVYEHLDDDLSCEGAIGLRAVSPAQFFDDGHAIQWAIQEALK